MKAEIFWLPTTYAGRIGIMARPRSGDWLEDEIKAWAAEGVTVAVSLLTSGEVVELGLTEEAALCKRNNIRFVSFPIPDRSVPAATTPVSGLIGEITDALRRGQNVAIHCRAGVGRSSTIAACVLVQSGMHARHAFATIGDIRGLSVPDTDEQAEWVTQFER